MATQDSTRENGFVASDAEEGVVRNDSPYARRPPGDADREPDAAPGNASAGVDLDGEMEFEEILLPASLRDSLSELAEAVRNVVRTQPLGLLAAAAAAAYLAGRRASRR